MAQNVKELKLISLLKSKVRLVFFKEEEEKKSIGLRTCKHSIFVIMIIVLGGLLCWSKRVACIVL